MCSYFIFWNGYICDQGYSVLNLGKKKELLLTYPLSSTEKNHAGY